LAGVVAVISQQGGGVVPYIYRGRAVRVSALADDLGGVSWLSLSRWSAGRAVSHQQQGRAVVLVRIGGAVSFMMSAVVLSLVRFSAWVSALSR
jgi:hypothetical protein